MSQSHACSMPSKPSSLDDLLHWAASPDNSLIHRPQQQLDANSTHLVDMLRCGCNIDVLTGANQYCSPYLCSRISLTCQPGTAVPCATPAAAKTRC